MAEKKMPAIRTVTFGLIPSSSKNMWSVGRGGHIYLDQKAKKQREALITYLKALTPVGEEWACRCEVGIDLLARETSVTLIPLELWDGRACPDVDGIATSILDAMQLTRYNKRFEVIRSGAGILSNDNRVRQLNVEVK